MVRRKQNKKTYTRTAVNVDIPLLQAIHLTGLILAWAANGVYQVPPGERVKSFPVPRGQWDPRHSRAK